MNVTKDRFKYRQLHNEGHSQMVSAEQKEYAKACDCQRIAENNNIITDFQTDNLLQEILRRDNLNRAYLQVKRNKGAGGVDKMQVEELYAYLRNTASK